MDTGERDVVCRRDCNRIRDLAGGESEKFPRARGGRDRKLSAWVNPFAITGAAAENLHWISYATARARMKSSPDAPACSAAARTVHKLSLGWQSPPGAM